MVERVEEWLRAAQRESANAPLSLLTAAEIACEQCQLIEEGQKREGRKPGSTEAMQVDPDCDTVDNNTDLYLEEDPWLKELSENFNSLGRQTRDFSEKGGDFVPKKGRRVDPNYSVGATLAANDEARLLPDPQCLSRGWNLPIHNDDKQPLKVQPADPRRYHGNVMAMDEQQAKENLTCTRNAAIRQRELDQASKKLGLNKDTTSSPHGRKSLLSHLKHMAQAVLFKTRTRKLPKSSSVLGKFSAMCSGVRQSFSTTFRSHSPSEGPWPRFPTATRSISNSRHANVSLKFVDFESLSVEKKARAYYAYYEGLEKEEKLYACPPAAYVDMLMKESQASHICNQS